MKQKKQLEEKKKLIEQQRVKDVRSVHTRIPTAKNIQSEAPPFLVVVFGPPKSGKTTLIRSLLRYYSKQKVSSINGIITAVTCNN